MPCNLYFWSMCFNGHYAYIQTQYEPYSINLISSLDCKTFHSVTDQRELLIKVMQWLCNKVVILALHWTSTVGVFGLWSDFFINNINSFIQNDLFCDKTFFGDYSFRLPFFIPLINKAILLILLFNIIASLSLFDSHGIGTGTESRCSRIQLVGHHTRR